MNAIHPLLIRLFFIAAFVVPVTGVVVFPFSSPAWAQQEIAGRYKLKGAEIVHTITIPPQRPAAVIVVQYLPPGTEIVQTTPQYSSYDGATGTVKWLFIDAQPGPLQLRLTLGRPVDSRDIRAEVLFKDQSGTSSTYTIAPAPVIRKALEGC